MIIDKVFTGACKEVLLEVLLVDRWQPELRTERCASDPGGSCCCRYQPASLCKQSFCVAQKLAAMGGMALVVSGLDEASNSATNSVPRILYKYTHAPQLIENSCTHGHGPDYPCFARVFWCSILSTWVALRRPEKY